MSTALAVRQSVITPDFKQRVEKLVERRNEAAQSLKDAKLALLDFCRDYFDLYNEAKTRVAKEYLAKHTGLTKSTVRSTFKSIGEHHGVLKKHLALLPASQEGIKAISVALKRNPKTIDILKTRNVLVSGTEASVSGIRTGIRRFIPDNRRKKTVVIDLTRIAPELTEYAVSVLSSNHDAVVVALASVMKSSTAVSLKFKDVSLREDVKEALGPQWLKTHGARLV